MVWIASVSEAEYAYFDDEEFYADAGCCDFEYRADLYDELLW